MNYENLMKDTIFPIAVESISGASVGHSNTQRPQSPAFPFNLAKTGKRQLLVIRNPLSPQIKVTMF